MQINIKICQSCNQNKAQIVRPKTHKLICLPCFYQVFETEIHYTIISNNLFKPGDRVAIGASGGKDSTVLIHVLNLLNQRYNYGLKLYLLSIDEGITGYRDDSLETVKDNQKTYGNDLTILSYKDLYGWTMDEIVKEIGMDNNCTFCGVFRRQALDRGSMQLKVDKIVTGHNADDIAETVLMNLLRGDNFRLNKCVKITTSTEEEEDEQQIPRIKPFKYTYEKEIVLYAYHKKLVYFSTECTYSKNAFRGNVRELIKKLEKIRPSTIVDIIHSAEQIKSKKDARVPQKMTCDSCKWVSSNKICKVCFLLQQLNQGKAKLKLEVEH